MEMAIQLDCKNDTLYLKRRYVFIIKEIPSDKIRKYTLIAKRIHFD